MIAGITTPDEGQIILSKNVQVGYLAQDSGLDSTRTIYAEMLTIFDDLRQMEAQMHELETAIADTTIDHASEEYAALLKRYDRVQHDFSEANGYGYEAEIRGVLHGFQFPEDTFEKPISTLSGANARDSHLLSYCLRKKTSYFGRTNEPFRYRNTNVVGKLFTNLSRCLAHGLAWPVLLR